MTYGCHNRPPFKTEQVLHGIESHTGLLMRVRIPFRMNPDCQYTKTDLGQSDKGCDGCKWRKNA